jgi:hypothetical protein
MSKGITLKIWALVVTAAIVVLTWSGCEIHIGPGTTTGETSDPTGSGGKQGAGPSFSPEEQAASNAYENVDPTEAMLKDATAAYSAASCSSLVEAQAQDPANVDEATVQQLFNQYGSVANEAALAWMELVDASSLSSDGVYTKNECILPPNSCRFAEPCPLSDGALCIVTGCGKGKCPWCDLFGGLIYESYCTYACMQGTKYWGYGFNLRTRFAKSWSGFVCFPFGK